jgi:hypothetical protein
MTIKCLKNIFANGMVDYSIREGNEYLVISMYINLHTNELEYQIINESKILGIYNNSNFVVINNNVESDWVFIKRNESYFEFTPKVISYDSFLEDFHNDEKFAIDTFCERFPKMI